MVQRPIEMPTYRTPGSTSHASAAASERAVQGELMQEQRDQDQGRTQSALRSEQVCCRQRGASARASVSPQRTLRAGGRRGLAAAQERGQGPGHVQATPCEHSALQGGLPVYRAQQRVPAQLGVRKEDPRKV